MAETMDALATIMDTLRRESDKMAPKETKGIPDPATERTEVMVPHTEKAISLFDETVRSGLFATMDERDPLNDEQLDAIFRDVSDDEQEVTVFRKELKTIPVEFASAEDAVNAFDSWLARENKEYERALARGVTKEFIEKYSRRRAWAVSRIMSAAKDNPAVYEDTRRELLLRAGALWTIEADILRGALKVREAGSAGAGGTEALSSVMSAITAEMLRKGPDGSYVKSPIAFWDEVRNSTPDVEIFRKMMANRFKGSIAETLVARALDCSLSVREKGLRVSVSEAAEDSLNGYDLVLEDPSGDRKLMVDVTGRADRLLSEQRYLWFHNTGEGFRMYNPYRGEFDDMVLDGNANRAGVLFRQLTTDFGTAPSFVDFARRSGKPCLAVRISAEKDIAPVVGRLREAGGDLSTDEYAAILSDIPESLIRSL